MERRIAVFIDFENIARSMRERSPDERVDLRAVFRALIDPPSGAALAGGGGEEAPISDLKEWRTKQ
jgi:hypothetical protein